MLNKFSLSLVTIACLSSGCAPYLGQSRPMLEAYYRGNFQEAAELAGKIRPRDADKLISLLDKGTTHHAAQNYKKSIKYFSKASALAEINEKQAALPQFGAVFANDNVMPYVASTYERILIYTFQMMNYAAIGDTENALVEVRRLNTFFPDLYSEREHRKYLQNSFTAYLSGLVWESGGFCNDAHIDFKRVDKLTKKPADLKSDIERTKVCAGLMDSSGEKIKRSNLIVILEAGISPIKRSTEYEAPLQIIPIPVYEKINTRTSRLSIKKGGESAGATSILEDVSSSLEMVLEEEMPGIIARAMARLAVKEGIAIAVGKKVDKNLGLAIGTMALATNMADLRSWRTLPETFQIWHGYLTPGKQTISLDFTDKNGNKLGSKNVNVDINDETIKFLILRTVE